MNSSKNTIIIVGAGPTGLSMAVQLLRYHIDFILLEKNEKTTFLSKALIVHARSLEIFEEISLAEKAIKAGSITTGINLFYKGKRKVTADFGGLGEGMSQFTFALSLEQSKTEKLLVDHLLANGKNVQWESEFSHFEQSEAGVIVFYKDKLGNIQQVEGAYLVGCDGANSPIRHQLGSTFEGDTVPKLFYVADVLLKSSVINKEQLFMFLIAKGFILFFPMEGQGHYRIIGILPDAAADNENFDFADIENAVQSEVMVPLEIEKVLWFSHYKVHSRMANSFSKDRCFIAGDAAHIHTPAGGQGMNTGIQDAYNLAWKLALTIKYNVNADILKSYNTERLENARNLLRTTDRVFDMMAGTTGFWDFFRLKIFPVIAGFITKNALIRKRLFPFVSQIGIAYPDSALTIESRIDTINAGDRMPYFVFTDGKSVYEYIAKPCFKVLCFGNGTSELDQFKSLPLEIDSHSFAEIPKKVFGNNKDFYILLRPDNHISYIGKDWTVGIDFLKKITSA